jgi:hypothetical protein
MSAAVLADAGVEALAELYPRWRIWADADTGWHACRRGGFIQDYHQGAPAFSVHAYSAGELAAQLRWQAAAETHTPFGCSRAVRAL